LGISLDRLQAMMHILKDHTLANKWRWEYSRAMILYKGKIEEGKIQIKSVRNGLPRNRVGFWPRQFIYKQSFP
jgi:hypothetical protein